MAKLSVWSPWLSSLFMFFSATVFSDAMQPGHLEQRDLKKPAVISEWLKSNGATADKARAKLFFDEGLKDKKRGAWDPAAKSFGESALVYPTPHALIETANADLHALGNTRARKKNYAQKSRSDMTSVELIYRSALAADAVLNTLNTEEKKQTQQNADCLTAFIQSGKIQPDCLPLQAYGLSK
jgi:hypothetical protein